MEKHDFKQVLQHSPFHARVEACSLVKSWTSWNGYQTARVFDTLASEYFAIRSSCYLKIETGPCDLCRMVQ